MTKLPSLTVHSALGELDRALRIAESAQRPGNENLAHLRSAFEDVRTAAARTLPAQAAAARAADLFSTMPQRGMRPAPLAQWPAWIEEVGAFLESLAATGANPPAALAVRAAELLAKDWREAMGEHPIVRSAEWVDDVRDLLRDLAAGRLAEAVKIDEQQKRTGASLSTEADLVARKKLNDTIRGLVRAAEFREQEQGGALWDDEVRNALAHARELGWGKNQIGRLDGAIGVDVVARRRLAEMQEGLKQDVVRYHRLRIIGAAPGGTANLASGTVVRFTNLDAWLDEEIRRHPSRGEARADLSLDDSPIAAAEVHLENARAGSRKLGSLIAKAYPDPDPMENVAPELRQQAELLYDATDKDPARIPELRTVLQANIAAAVNEMYQAIMALRTEVPSSVADEILRRFDLVKQAYIRRQSQPTHELVSLRYFHENVAKFATTWKYEDCSPEILERFLREVLSNDGHALMSPRETF